MRLLLTRSMENAARTRAKLERAGHEVSVSSVIENVPTGAKVPTGVIDALVATSAQAFFAPGELGLRPETARVMPLLLVGRRTKEAARQHGFLGQAVAAANAGALISKLDELDPPPRRMVYLAGRDRKPDIEEAMRAGDRIFEMVEVYEARPIEEPDAAVMRLLGAGAVDGVLHFSRRSASLFAAQMEKAGTDLVPALHFCLSDDVAEPLREKGWGTHVAETPDESALLALIAQA